MSRRYGRNQRRRARERIAQLELEATNHNRARAMDRGLLASMTERNRALAAIVDLVRQELPNHPLLPVNEELGFSYMAREVRAGEGMRVPLRGPAPSKVSLAGPSSAMEMDTEHLFADMVALLDSTDFSELRQQVHLGVRLGPEEVVYAISTHALVTMDQKLLEEILTPRIAREMARSLIQAWRGPGRTRRGW